MEEKNYTKLELLKKSNILVKNIKDLIVENESIDDSVKRKVLILYAQYNLHYMEIEHKITETGSAIDQYLKDLEKIIEGLSK